jgi:hypothetical protein
MLREPGVVTLLIRKSADSKPSASCVVPRFVYKYCFSRECGFSYRLANVDLATTRVQDVREMIQKLGRTIDALSYQGERLPDDATLSDVGVFRDPTLLTGF